MHKRKDHKMDGFSGEGLGEREWRKKTPQLDYRFDQAPNYNFLKQRLDVYCQAETDFGSFFNFRNKWNKLEFLI